jgi:hypothetical protein
MKLSKTLAKRTLAVSASLALALTGSFAMTGSASADGTSQTMTFESDDTLGLATAGGSFGGSTTAIATFGPTGDALAITKAGETYSGANLILDTDGLQLASNANTVMTVDYYSAASEASPVMFKLQTEGGWPGGKVCFKAVEAAAGWNALTIDWATAHCVDASAATLGDGNQWNPGNWITTGYDGTANYKLLAVFPDFGADDPTYTGAAQVAYAGEVYYIDNVVIGTAATLTPSVKVTGPSKKVLRVDWSDALGQKVKVVVKGVRTWTSSSRVSSNASGSVKLTVPSGTYKVTVTVGSKTVVKTQVVK